MKKIEQDLKLDYSDVLIVPQASSVRSRNDVNLLVKHNDTKVVPIIAANMDNVGTFEMAKALVQKQVMTCLVKHYKVEEFVEFYSTNHELSGYVVHSMGANQDDLEKFNKIKSSLAPHTIKTVCIDVANAYTDNFLRFVSEFKNNNLDIILHAGNVVTPEITQQLILVGVDYVKIGVGPGSVCLTRKVAGVGYPQLSAVLECVEAATSAGGKIIADGGCTVSGDVSKALVAGANLVMLGGMLAGHVEGYDKSVYERWKQSGYGFHKSIVPHVPFHGMASKEAQKMHCDDPLKDYCSSEGKEVKITIKGRVKYTIDEILGGIRSTCAYIGVHNVEEMSKGTFVKVNRQMNNIFD